MIGSAPNAVTYHSRKTWNNYKAVHDRAKRWGTMENYIVARHPELYKKVIPKNYILETLMTIFLGVVAAVSQSLTPLIIAGSWIVLNWLIDYALDIKNNGFSSPIYFYGAMLIQFQYEFYRVKQSFKNHSLGALNKGIIFNRFQIKYGMKNEAFRIKKLLYSFIVVAMVVMIVNIFI